MAVTVRPDEGCGRRGHRGVRLPGTRRFSLPLLLFPLLSYAFLFPPPSHPPYPIPLVRRWILCPPRRSWWSLPCPLRPPPEAWSSVPLLPPCCPPLHLLHSPHVPIAPVPLRPSLRRSEPGPPPLPCSSTNLTTRLPWSWFPPWRFPLPAVPSPLTCGSPLRHCRLLRSRSPASQSFRPLPSLPGRRPARGLLQTPSGSSLPAPFLVRPVPFVCLGCLPRVPDSVSAPPLLGSPVLLGSRLR